MIPDPHFRDGRAGAKYERNVLMRRLLLLILAVASAACTGDGGTPPAGSSAPPSAGASGGPEILPLIISSELTKGPTRLLFSLTDRANKLISAPDVKVHLEFYDVDTAEGTVVFESDARFLWAIEGERGLYATDVTFPDAGRWGTRFTATLADGSTKAVRADYDVVEAGPTVAVGAKAPSVETPTIAGVGGDVRAVSTDQEPAERFYTTSVDGAIAARKPFVLAFATPAFCQTQICGPTLQTVKTVAKGYPDLTFINVEPYQMTFENGSLQPALDASGQLQSAAWTDAFGLRTEPWIFVIGADGTVRAKFEAVVGGDELRAAIDAAVAG
jgi:hypothetical protein